MFLPLLGASYYIKKERGKTMGDSDFGTSIGWGIAGLVGGALLNKGGGLFGNNAAYVNGADAGLATAAIIGAMNNNGTQYATSNEVQRGFDNQNSMANQREILNAITSGTAQGVAATNQTFHDTLNVLQDKYNETTRDIYGLSTLVQQGNANNTKCCCDVLRAVDGVNYNGALNTASINSTIKESTNEILKTMMQNENAALRLQNNQLFIQNQMNGVVRFPQSVNYAVGLPPFINGAPQPPFNPFA